MALKINSEVAVIVPKDKNGLFLPGIYNYCIPNWPNLEQFPKPDDMAYSIYNIDRSVIPDTYIYISEMLGIISIRVYHISEDFSFDPILAMKCIPWRDIDRYSEYFNPITREIIDSLKKRYHVCL